MNSIAALQHASCTYGMSALMHSRVLTAKMMVSAEITTAILKPTNFQIWHKQGVMSIMLTGYNKSYSECLSLQQLQQYHEDD